MLNKKHFPSEIFGFPTENRSSTATKYRQKHWCPFVNKVRNKQSRLIKYPMGVCSTWFSRKPVAICPRRFLQNRQVFVDVAKLIFNDINNIVIFPEVKLRSVGTFDFIMAKHKVLSNEIEDFCAIELQTDSTTGTGKLVNALREFFKGESIEEKRYAYGMNTYNTIKLSFIQMLNKGQVFEIWNKKILWIVQDYVFNNMVERFKLSRLKYKKDQATIFMVYSLIKSNSMYHLKNIKVKSSKVNNLMRAFKGAQLPRLEEFIDILNKKLKLNIGIRLT